jgi:hypothetical protein
MVGRCALLAGIAALFLATGTARAIEPDDPAPGWEIKRTRAIFPQQNGRTTGIELVDRELERHGPFSNPEAAEIMTAKLLSIWHMLRPDSVDDKVAPAGQSRHRAHRR